MPATTDAPHRVYRFGVFEVDVRSGEVRKRGVRQHLQGKPFQVLVALLERPGDVVTREELQRRLWSSDVFVDSENGLNTAINRLRLTLGDSAEHPRYVETLARTGYRFIAPVQGTAMAAAQPPPPEPVSDPATNGYRAIDSTSGESTQGTVRDVTVAAAVPPARRRRRAAVGIAAALVLGAMISIGTVVAVREPAPRAFAFKPVTFRRGQVSGARFAPDGRSVLYTAAWDDGLRRLFLTSPLSPESRALGLDGYGLVSISRSGELALLQADGTLPIAGGSLARVPMNGGAPKAVEQNVMSADWAPDGQLAIARMLDGTTRLEFPPGSVRHQTSGWISSVRVSPRGDFVAFLEHPLRHDNRGTLKLVATRDARTLLSSTARALTHEWTTAGGVAWHPTRDEIWFTASRDGAPKSLWAVSTSGALRSVTQIAGTMTLRDVAPDGSTLATRDTEQLEMAAVDVSTNRQRNLSWLDWSRVVDVSRDGQVVLFDETGTGGGPASRVYIRRLDDDSTVRLGEGLGLALAPDAKTALTVNTNDRTRLRRVPMDGRPAEDLPASGLAYQWARFFPDGHRLLVQATDGDGPVRLYVQDLETPRVVPLTPPGVVRNAAVSADGNRVAVLGADGVLRLYASDGRGPATIVATEQRLAPVLWPTSSRLLVQHIGAYTQIPTSLSWLDLETGRTEPWRTLQPRDVAGVDAITKVMASADERTVVFNYRRVLSELFVSEATAR